MSLDVNIEPEEFNTSELHKCIEYVAKINGFKEFEYQVEFACEKNDSFIANIFRVMIKESEDDKNVNVIVKTLVNTTRQELFDELHKREVFVYKEVISKFKEMQNDVDIDDRIELPECIYSTTEKNKEIIILEDLSVKGFVMDDKIAKFQRLDYLQVRLVMTELAKFHALSFILENKDPDYFKALSSQLHDILFQDNFLNKSKLRSYFIDSYTASLKVVTDTKARKKLERIEPKLLQILKKYVQPKKYSVLCHGDCWMNNILFKHEAMKPSQICFLDFQAMRYASPTLDIVYFLYLCTDSEFRSEYFETLQNVYYDSMKCFLKLYNYDVNEIYPRESFITDLNEALPFGLMIALIEMRIVTTESENLGVLKSAPSLLSVNESQPDNSGDERLLNIRINDLVKESVENGVLNKLLDVID